MKNRRNMIIGALLALCLVVPTAAWAQLGQGPRAGDRQGAGFGERHGGAWGQNLAEGQKAQVKARIQGLRGGMGQLTPEQRAQVKTEVQELRAAGAEPVQVRERVAEMLRGWGVEPPAPQTGPRLGRLAHLTPEQSQQVQATVQQMREAGTPPAEIRAAIGGILSGWGIQLPAAHPAHCPQ